MPEDPVSKFRQHDYPRVSNAAGHAINHVFPGTAIGRLLHRELVAYKELGYLFGSDSLSEQLIREIIELHNAGVVITPDARQAA
jgi:hypothetical protein